VTQDAVGCSRHIVWELWWVIERVRNAEVPEPHETPDESCASADGRILQKMTGEAWSWHLGVCVAVVVVVDGCGRIDT